MEKEVISRLKGISLQVYATTKNSLYHLQNCPPLVLVVGENQP